MADCSACGGSSNCVQCNGAGRYPCPGCNDGTTADGERHDACSGRGTFPCGNCNATGRCPSCGGRRSGDDGGRDGGSDGDGGTGDAGSGDNG